MGTVSGTATVGGVAFPVSASITLPSAPILVGNTIPNVALNTAGSYDQGLTQDAADTKFCQIVNRGLDNSQHLAVTKKFWGPNGDFDTAKNDLAHYAKFGTTVILCLWPSASLTTVDRASLGTFLGAMPALGITGKNSYVVLMQEPTAGKNMPPTSFQGYYEFYGPTVTQAGFPLVADIGTSVGAANLQAYGEAAVAAMKGAPFKLAGLAQDFYAPEYINGGVRLDVLPPIADANGIAFGVFEHGCVPSKFTVAQCTEYMDYVRNFMVARKGAGKKCLPVLYYNGQHDPTGAGDLTSPIGQDPSVVAPDFRIGLWRQLYDELCGL